MRGEALRELFGKRRQDHPGNAWNIELFCLINRNPDEFDKFGVRPGKARLLMRDHLGIT